MTALARLRAATPESIPGSHLKLVRISAADVRDLRKQIHNRASRNALQIALDSGTDPTHLLVDDRDRIVLELTAPSPEALRRVGAL